jgi:WD40 repeat protein
MNSASVFPTPNEIESGFPSLAALRAVHGDLLKQYRQDQDNGMPLTAQLLSNIEAFIRRGQATGALLDSEDDRWATQSLLDYWIAILYRSGFEPPEATLADFDSSLAPELDDSLCPYLGLEAFQEDDHKRFYGRQRLLDQLLQKLQESRLLAVVGSSGSGKSSVVLGGLIPSLKAGKLPGSENWHYHGSMVPGSNPLENLALLFCPECDEKSGSIEQNSEKFIQNSSYLTELLNHTDNQPSVLVIDQFEETFQLCLDEVKRQAFISNLLEVIQFPEVSHRIILTMRSDLEYRITIFSAFDSLFKDSRVTVLSLGADELREAIEKPAESVGLKFEEGLVDKLIEDFLGEDSALPLLQFTLLKFWGNRERNRISMEAYKKLGIGGGRLALSNSADDFYNNDLLPEDRPTCKGIFLKMVQPTEGKEFTRSRILRRELYQSEFDRVHVEKVLTKLIEAHLVKFTKGDMSKDAQVEVAHEALLRNWSTLTQWLAEERVKLHQRYLLVAAPAQRWEEKNRDPSILLRDSELKDAQKYDGLNKLESEFIAASVKAEERLKEQEKEQQERELRLIQEKLNQAIIAQQAVQEKLNQEEIAREAEQKALEQEKRATDEARNALEQKEKARQVSQKLLFGTRIAMIMLALLSFAGFWLWKDAEQKSMRAQQESMRAEQKSMRAQQESMMAQQQFKKAQQQFKKAQQESIKAQQQFKKAQLQMIEAQKAQKVAEKQKKLALSQKVILEERNKKIVAQQKEIEKKNQQIQDQQKQLLEREKGKTQVAQDATNKESIRGNVADVQNKLSSSEPVKGLILSIKTAGDCLKYQKVCQPDQLVHNNVKNALKKAMQEAREKDVFMPKPISIILSAAFSQNGQSIFSGDGQGIFQSWTLKGDKASEPKSLTCKNANDSEGDKNNVNVIAISTDGSLIVSGGKDGTILLCDHHSSEPKILKGLETAIRAIAISPDGQLIVSGNEDGNITIWNSQGERLVDPFLAHGGKEVLSLAINQDSNGTYTIVSGSAGTTKNLGLWNDQGKSLLPGDSRTWHNRDPKPLDNIWQNGAVYSVAFSQNGKWIVSGSGDGTIRIWDVDRQKLLAQSEKVDLPGRFFSVTSFRADEKRLVIASGSDNQTIRLWKWQEGENTIKPIGNLSPLKGHSGKVNSLAFSKDGQTLISGSGDGTIRLWDMRDIQNQSNLENKDLNSLLKTACDRLRYHPSLNNDAKAKQACEKKKNESIPTKTH